MAAPKSLLQALHEELTQQMLDELRWYKENEIPLPAADKAAMAKFLKDNNITCDPADSGDIERLRKEFEEQRAARKERALSLVTKTQADIHALYGEAAQ